ncbi:MAG: glycosyltransferase family 4 protein [Candidatus Tectomicrobia bacterium]|nr:glycosyltransferase family 4 protein [Candidatus Tectomicrobia bacterium]
MRRRATTRSVTFLNRSFFPDVEATGQFLTELCEDLSGSLPITVVAGSPLVGASTLNGRRRPMLPFRRERYKNIEVLRCRHTRFAKRNFIGRLCNLATFFISAACALCFHRPSLLVTQTDPPVLGVLGLLVARLRRCPMIFSCQDVFPDIARLSGKVKNRFILWTLERITRATLRGADHVVALSDDMLELLARKAPIRTKATVVHNWVDTAAIRPVAPEENWFRARHAPEGAFVVGYSGNLGVAQGLETVLEAAAALRREADLLFLFIGEGASKRVLQEKATAWGLRNVRFLPYQPREHLAYSLSAVDLHLIPLRGGLHGMVAPSKVYGIAAVGRPFIALVEESSDLARLAREHDCGIVVPPGDADALRQAILRLHEQPPLRARLGENGRRAALRCFDRTMVTRAMRKLLVKVLAANGAPNGGERRVPAPRHGSARMAPSFVRPSE